MNSEQMEPEDDEPYPEWVLYKDGNEVERFFTKTEAEEEAQQQFEDEKMDFGSESEWRRWRSYWEVKHRP